MITMMMMMKMTIIKSIQYTSVDGQGSIPGRAKFSLIYSVQTGSGAHPSSYSVGTREFSPGGKVAGA
jgi:hypothetical protein